MNGTHDNSRQKALKAILADDNILGLDTFVSSLETFVRLHPQDVDARRLLGAAWDLQAKVFQVALGATEAHNEEEHGTEGGIGAADASRSGL